MRFASTFSNVGLGIGMARGLVMLTSSQCTVESAKALLRRRMAERDQIFLRMVRETIWAHPKSVYRRLLSSAGWTDETLAQSVRGRGVEATLEALRDSGVYLSHEEFKAGKPVHRDGLMLDWDEVTTNNPLVSPSYEVRTGGTRSRGTRVPSSFDYLADQRGPAWRLTLEALGVGSWPTIVWLPRNAGLQWWLALMHMGRPPLRWFSITDLSSLRIPLLHQAMFRLGQVIGRTRGLRVPYYEHVPLSDADVVLDAMLAARARHRGCAVITSPSAATRLAGLARQRSTTLEGVAFLVGGEPLTRGKSDEITRAGARVGVRYNITEAGAVGGACTYPADADDVHLVADSFALIPRRRALPDGGFADGFMITTLLPSSPMILLNVDSDDFGQVVTRRCGCIWDALGMQTHLTNIRSFSKLTGEGVTVLGTECVRILEEVLPREFGGRSIDYQLLEVEDEHHLTRLHLVVSPSVGQVDEEKLLLRFKREIGGTAQGGGAVSHLWRQADTIRVVRREPVMTPGGKLLAFHTLAFARGPEDSHAGS